MHKNFKEFDDDEEEAITQFLGLKKQSSKQVQYNPADFKDENNLLDFTKAANYNETLFK